MKNNLVVMLCIFMLLSLFSCSSGLCLNKRHDISIENLRKRTDEFIGRSQKEADTIYMYSFVFSGEYQLVWYYKRNSIQSFLIGDCKIKKFKTIKAQNIDITNDAIDSYMCNSPAFKEIKCFEMSRGGGWLSVYIKGKEPLYGEVNMDCLFSTKYPKNSFPYKLQYDFAKINSWASESFKELYPDVE